MRAKRIISSAAIAAGLIAIGLGSIAHSQDKPAEKGDSCPNCKKDAKAENVSDEKTAEAPKENGKVREIHLYSVDKEWKFADGKSTYVMGYSNWDDGFSKAPSMSPEVQ